MSAPIGPVGERPTAFADFAKMGVRDLHVLRRITLQTEGQLRIAAEVRQRAVGRVTDEVRAYQRDAKDHATYREAIERLIEDRSTFWDTHGRTIRHAGTWIGIGAAVISLPLVIALMLRPSAAQPAYA